MKAATVGLIVCLVSTLTFSQVMVCPTVPPVQPVLSNSPDDIPATTDYITTYTGAQVRAQANKDVQFVQINDNDQRVWIGLDTSPGFNKTYYNRRLRADASSPWYWQYQYSFPVIANGDAPSAGPTAVLYSSTPKYNYAGTNYSFLMYLVFQPSDCNGKVAGFLHVAFSNDGVCWIQPVPVTRYGGPGPYQCYPFISNTVPTEAMSAVDGGDTVYLIGVEGDVHQLVQDEPYTSYWMSQTQTYIATAPTSTFSGPTVITLLPTNCCVSGRSSYPSD